VSGQDGTLQCSTALLGDPGRLRRRFSEEGYAFFSGVLPVAVLRTLRREILEICAREGWIAGGEDLEAAHAIRAPVNEGEADYFPVYDAIQRLESFHALAHDPDVMRLMRALLGDSAFPHPLGIARLMFPDNNECATPPHQDYPNNQGTPELYACWIPLGDCPREHGGIAILERSHTHGVLPLAFSLGAGGRHAVLEGELATHRWLSRDFAAGDALVFHSHTVHRSLHNLSPDRMRLSVDFRYQREGEALVARSLQPHFGRLEWDEIYAGWSGRAPRRYWEERDYKLVDWDERYHGLPDEHLREAVRQKRAYEARRRSRPARG